ncbi:MAG: DUF1097 family protein [Firmicutes bacterium]|nr:DUF1097 family protein [Bacillota bacterium]
MKKFWEMSKTPLIIAVIASLLYIVDSLVSPLIGLGRGFMWVAFVAWTISFSMTTEQKVRMWIGHFIGFGAAVGMIYFGRIFTADVAGVAIASLIGVFIFNGLVMYFDNLKKFWLNSITGIFMGIFLTFSGLGVGIGPDTAGDAFTILGVIVLYSFLGAVCAHFSVYFMKKFNKTKEAEAEVVENGQE